MFQSNDHKIMPINTSAIQFIDKTTNVCSQINENVLRSNIQPKQCRICLQEDQAEYVKPCICEGSLGYVHHSCMKNYIYHKFKNVFIRKPAELMRVTCEVCNRQILFEYDIQSKLQCSSNNPNLQKSTTWTVLLILTICFSLIFCVLLMTILAFYISLLQSVLILRDTNGLWVLMTITPLFGVALVIIAYYFIVENLYGKIVIRRIKNKNQTVISKYKRETVFNYSHYVLEE